MNGVPLGRLLREMATLRPSVEAPGPEEMAVTGVAYDSRRTAPGDAFVCLAGLEADGHRFAAAAVRAGAARVVALEANPRARALAGFNIVLNGCEDRIEIRDGSRDVFAPVAGQRFDYVISNPPFLPASPGAQDDRQSAAGPYGLDVLQAIVSQLDRFLSDCGHAQIVTLAPGDRQEPFLLTELARKHLSGRTLVKVNAVPAHFVDTATWMWGAGAATPENVGKIKVVARRDGVSHLHLCTVHYDKGWDREVTVVKAEKVYRDWYATLPASVCIHGQCGAQSQ